MTTSSPQQQVENVVNPIIEGGISAAADAATVAIEGLCASCHIPVLPDVANKLKFYAVQLCDKCLQEFEDTIVSSIDKNTETWIEQAKVNLNNLSILKAKKFITDEFQLVEQKFFGKKPEAASAAPSASGVQENQVRQG